MSAPVEVKQCSMELEYAKNTGVTPEDVAKLRGWLATQPHLPGDLITDLDLVLAYHCCQCSAEVSKQVLDLHFTIKTLCENLFKERVVSPKILNALSVVSILPLKIRAYDGSAVLYCKVIDPDARKYIYTDVIRAALMVIDLWQEEDGSWPGLQIIMDMRMFSLQHLAKVDLQTMQQFLYYLQEAMLVKLTAIHFINASALIDKVTAMFKAFLKKEVMGSLFVHQVGATSLEEHMPLEGLPEEAGGKYKSVGKGSVDMQERFRLNVEFFEREAKRRVVESRRPSKAKTISDIFRGIEGSFKKLDID